MKQNLKVGWVLLYYFEFVSDNKTNEKVSCYYKPLTLIKTKYITEQFYMRSYAPLYTSKEINYSKKNKQVTEH